MTEINQANAAKTANQAQQQAKHPLNEKPLIGEYLVRFNASDPSDLLICADGTIKVKTEGCYAMRFKVDVQCDDMARQIQTHIVLTSNDCKQTRYVMDNQSELKPDGSIRLTTFELGTWLNSDELIRCVLMLPASTYCVTQNSMFYSKLSSTH